MSSMTPELQDDWRHLYADLTGQQDYNQDAAGHLEAFKNGVAIILARGTADGWDRVETRRADLVTASRNVIWPLWLKVLEIHPEWQKAETYFLAMLTGALAALKLLFLGEYPRLVQGACDKLMLSP